MEEAGVVVDERLVVDTGPNVDDSVVAGARRAADSLFDVDPPPTAVFAHNDLIAIAVVQAARRRSLRVPDDVSVVGVDDIEAGRYVDPPLTTVPFPSRELGRTAARTVLDAIAGGAPPATVLAPSELVVRGSTGPPPVAGQAGRVPCGLDAPRPLRRGGSDRRTEDDDECDDR
jgi:DNA-binding LacI/PurR family transcriptional regulator